MLVSVAANEISLAVCQYNTANTQSRLSSLLVLQYYEVASFFPPEEVFVGFH